MGQKLRALRVVAGDVVNTDNDPTPVKVGYTSGNRKFWGENGNLLAANQPIWNVVVRFADLPKPFGEMADEDAGLLLIAAHKGQQVQHFLPASLEWRDDPDPQWHSHMMYKLKSDPIIGEQTVQMGNTHSATMPTVDGEYVTGTFTGPDQHKITVAKL